MDIMSFINYLLWEYLAFLSFADHGDSVSGFINDLKAALLRKYVISFSADRRMVETEETVPSHIFEKIQKSQICIVIFTRNYADSVWCLEELSKIAQCIRQCIVIPIFYGVSAAHVQNQSSSYQGAFVDHEEKFRNSLELVQRWRVAMKQVASLRGWHAWIGLESQVIDDIVRYIMKKLGNDCPFGMETRVKKFEKFLNIGSKDVEDDDVQFVGISGMCGIGKTCLAQEVYDKICHKFDSHYFLFSADQIASDKQPILQQLEEYLMDGNNQSRCHKTLLVFDNVKEYNELKVLTRNSKWWFGRGSRIIVTTRDKGILKRCNVHKIFQVELLDNDEAHQLFCKHAYIRHNIDQDDEEFIHGVLEYANGLPLAIETIVYLLVERDPLEWKSLLEEMKQHPHKNIMHALGLSLCENKDYELEIFFYVACFFNGKDESGVIKILNSLSFCDNNRIGLRLLQEKSLINIRNGKIWMHNLLEQVGREFAQQMSLFSKFQYVDLELLAQVLTPNQYASTIPIDFKDCKYRAFISFADDDDSDDDDSNDKSFSNFIQHLIAALQRHDIFTFSADRSMVKTAKPIPTKISEVIQESQICIIIFTRNYADSVWCLEELAKIAQGIGTQQCIVIPIFYRVSPAKVRNQRSYFQVPFAQLEEQFRDSLDQVQSWREAMRKVASLRGWRAWIGTESLIIEDIVKCILRMFDHNDLVGIEARVEALQELLNIASNDDDDDHVRFVGISGMCGVGKTCLAQEVYERIYHRFDAHCFLYSETQFSVSGSLLILQQRLHESLMDDNNQPRCCKTLLVMDNVETLEQLKFLAAYFDGFVGRGSRIIITTRDESILRDHGVNKIYKVELLNKRETLQLFSKHAFKCDKPPNQDYERISHVVSNYANGLPLAIQLLGSDLFGQSLSEWESYVEKMQQHPAIMLLLKPSFDELRGWSKDIFLDIACFFNGKDKSHVMRILDSCGFFPLEGVKVLQDKSLVNVMDGKIWMHNLLQQLGREIVRHKFILNSYGETRLWIIKDFLHASETKLGTRRVDAIVLDLEILDETPLKFEALSKMENLRLLIIRNVNFVGQLYPLPWMLKYVSWHQFPFTYFPLSIEKPLLVDLILPHSSITQLWQGLKIVPRLRNLDLHGSKFLETTPNFEGLPNLESLDLEECSKIQQIDSSIETLQKLKFLNLRKCINLVSIPNSLFDVPSLEMLNLAGCSGFEKVLNFDSLEDQPSQENLTISITSQRIVPRDDEKNSSEIAQLKQEILEQKMCNEANREKALAFVEQAREEGFRAREPWMDRARARIRIMNNHFMTSNNDVGSSSRLAHNDDGVLFNKNK